MRFPTMWYVQPAKGFWEIAKMAFISGELGNKCYLLRGTKALLGNREHKMFFLLFLRTWVQANLFQRNKG